MNVAETETETVAEIIPASRRIMLFILTKQYICNVINLRSQAYMYIYIYIHRVKPMKNVSPLRFYSVLASDYDEFLFN